MEKIEDIPKDIPYISKVVCLFGLLNEDKITSDEFQEAQLRFFDEAYNKTKEKIFN